MQRRYHSKITRKGQITIAAQARREVGLNIGDPVDVIVDDGRIVGVEAAGNWAERTAGIFKHSGTALTPEEERDAFEQSVADDVMERARRQQEY